MTHGSLFSGIGGFDYAAEKMGWENLFHCEREPFGQRVLKYYWPEAKLYNDITTADFGEFRGRIDVLTGGFPCQPYSAAVKRLGKEDDRHLWPEMLRAIREIQPTWVVGENVLGIVSWNGGLVFDEVQTDLEAEGYEVQPYVLPASGVGAHHSRNRTWFCAYADSLGRKRRANGRYAKDRKREDNPKVQSAGRSERTFWDEDWASLAARTFPRNDGISERLDGVTFSKWRRESLKGAGNAVVPQVVMQIFRAIEKWS